MSELFQSIRINFQSKWDNYMASLINRVSLNILSQIWLNKKHINITDINWTHINVILKFKQEYWSNNQTSDSTIIKRLNNVFMNDKETINQFWPMFPFYTPWKHQKTERIVTLARNGSTFPGIKAFILVSKYRFNLNNIYKCYMKTSCAVKYQ